MLVLFSVGYAMFFVPEPYALSEPIYRLWQIAQLAIGAFASVVYLLSCRPKKEWGLFSLFFVTIFSVSSLASHSDGWVFSIIYSTAAGIGFISLTCLGFQKNQESVFLDSVSAER